MKITEAKLKKIISEEIKTAIGDPTDGPNQEDILEALSILSEANSAALKAEIEILEELLKRAKNSCYWTFGFYRLSCSKMLTGERSFYHGD